MTSVALLTPYCYDFDAVGAHVGRLAGELSRFYVVEIIAFHGNLRYPMNPRIHVKYLCTRPSFVSNIGVVTDLARKHKLEADVVFHQWAGGNSLFLYSLQHKLDGKATILDYHGVTPIEYTNPIKHKFIGYTSDPVLHAVHHIYSGIIVHSSFIQQDFQRRFNRRAHIIPLGVDTDFWGSNFGTRESLKVNYGLQKDEQVILFVGRVVRHKRVDFIIKALKILRQTSALKPKLLIVGPPDKIEVQRIKNISKSLNMENHVLFMGKVSKEDLAKLYCMADLFITASLHEGFCLPIIEAMASGTPVIASRCGAMPEVIGDSGITFSPFALDELVSAAEKVLLDTDLRRRLSRAAINRSKSFAWKVIGERFHEYIQALHV